jgi:membrane protease subunit HflC
MSMRWIAGLVAGFVLLLLLDASQYTVDQTEQVLITQLGQPVRVVSDPGWHTKVPFIETVISFDRRLLDYDVPAEEVILGDQKRLIVGSFTRYRITDPLRYYQAVGASDEAIQARLTSVVSSSLRQVLGNENLLAVLSSDRDRIMGQIRVLVNDEMKNFGVAIEDVRIRRADLPQENTEAILSRMQSERQRVASQARAEGAEAAARIHADADRTRTVLLAQASSTAAQSRGAGEAEATRIYAEAYGRDPEFYDTWRTLQAYRDSLTTGNTRLVLSPDSPFLRFLKSSPGAQTTR